MKERNNFYITTAAAIFGLICFQTLLMACGKSNHVQLTRADSLINGSFPAPSPPAGGAGVMTTDTLLGNGVDLQPSYYNGGNVTFGFALMQQNPKIKSVRIEIEPSVPIALAASWIRHARDSGYKVIATYHKYTVLGSDNTADINDGANWWKTNYNALATGGGSFIVNLINEWGSHNLTSNAYASACNDAIAIVRQVYKGPIILDCPGYGQETSVAADAVKGTNGTKITDTAVILSAHIYPNGYNQAKNHAFQQSDLDDLASAGRACIVGEFGSMPAGSVDWSGMVSYAKTKKWAVLGWSWNGDGGGMNMVTPAWTATANAASYSPSSYFTVIYSLL
jgi:mannan endo-1,4-beta-mannosidase